MNNSVPHFNSRSLNLSSSDKYIAEHKVNDTFMGPSPLTGFIASVDLACDTYQGLESSVHKETDREPFGNWCELPGKGYEVIQMNPLHSLYLLFTDVQAN